MIEILVLLKINKIQINKKKTNLQNHLRRTKRRKKRTSKGERKELQS